MPRLTNLNVVPERQTDALLDQAAPVQNTWYTALNTTLNCRIIDMGFLVATTTETIQIRFTVDGVITIADWAATNDTNYHVGLVTNATGPYLDFSTTAYSRDRAFFMEGRSIKIEVRKTTAAGNGNLKACVVYSKW